MKRPLAIIVRLAGRLPHDPVPIVAVVSAVVIAAVIVFTKQPYQARLVDTQQAACRFYVAEGHTRHKQASNSSKAVEAEGDFIHQLAAQQATAPAPLDALERAELTLWSAYAGAQRKNVALTRALAGQADRLASQLRCPPYAQPPKGSR